MTFCWFPPLRYLTSCSMVGATIANSLTQFVLITFSLLSFTKNHFLIRSRMFRVRFFLTDKVYTRPSRARFSVTNPTPLAIEDLGPALLIG